MNMKYIAWFALIAASLGIVFLLKLSFILFIVAALAFSILLLPPDVTRNPRIILLAFFIVVSLIIIGPNTNPTGVKITYVGKAAPPGISTGDILYFINQEPASA